jgi:hypothetical protein
MYAQHSQRNKQPRALMFITFFYFIGIGFVLIHCSIQNEHPGPFITFFCKNGVLVGVFWACLTPALGSDVTNDHKFQFETQMMQ